MTPKIDILIFGAHPDDIELGCGGTILSEIEKGKTVGLIDLTAGELGTRGSAEKRKQETDKASKILGVDFRLNLGMKDGLSTMMKIVSMKSSNLFENINQT